MRALERVAPDRSRRTSAAGHWFPSRSRSAPSPRSLFLPRDRGSNRVLDVLLSQGSAERQWRQVFHAFKYAAPSDRPDFSLARLQLSEANLVSRLQIPQLSHVCGHRDLALACDRRLEFSMRSRFLAHGRLLTQAHCKAPKLFCP